MCMTVLYCMDTRLVALYLLRLPTNAWAFVCLLVTHPELIDRSISRHIQSNQSVLSTGGYASLEAASAYRISHI